MQSMQARLGDTLSSAQKQMRVTCCAAVPKEIASKVGHLHRSTPSRSLSLSLQAYLRVNAGQHIARAGLAKLTAAHQEVWLPGSVAEPKLCDS